MRLICGELVSKKYYLLFKTRPNPAAAGQPGVFTEDYSSCKHGNKTHVFF